MLVNRLSTRMVYFAIEAILASGFSLLVTVLAARHGDVEAFGELALALAIVGFQLPVAALGLSALVYGRSASRAVSSKYLIRTALLIVPIFSVFIYILTCSLLYILNNYDVLILYALAGIKLIATFHVIFVQDAAARHKTEEYLIYRIIVLVLSILLLISISFLDCDMYIYALIWGGESFIFALILLIIYKDKAKTSNRISLIKATLLKSYPLAVQSLFVMLYMRFDQLYIGFRFGEEDLAKYVVAARLAETGNIIFNVLTLVVSPLIISHFNAVPLKLYFTKVISIILIGLNFIGFVLASLVGGVFINIVFGDYYEDSLQILLIYIFSVSFVAFGSIASRILNSYSITSPQALSGAAGALLNVILSIGLAEFWGMEGVALATVVSYAVAAGVLWIYVLQTASKYQSAA